MKLYLQMPAMENSVAIIHSDTQMQWKLSNKCSIYTAEALAILNATNFTANKTVVSQAIILSNSLSSLTRNQPDMPRKINNTQIRTSRATS